MDISVYTNIDVDIDDVLAAMNEKEKRELYESLGEELDEGSNITFDDDFDVAVYIQNMTAFDLKRILCTALDVPNYYDEQALREKLEPIIKA